MDAASTLGISSEKVCYIIVKARQFEAKDVVADPDSGSNPTDDGVVSVLEDQPDDPVYEELIAFIAGLNRMSRSISLPWPGSGAATLRSRNGMIFAARRPAPQRPHRRLSPRPAAPARASGGRPFPIRPLV